MFILFKKKIIVSVENIIKTPLQAATFCTPDISFADNRGFFKVVFACAVQLISLILADIVFKKPIQH